MSQSACEVCGGRADFLVRDLIDIIPYGPSKEDIQELHAGKPHYYCKEHTRDPKTIVIYESFVGFMQRTAHEARG